MQTLQRSTVVAVSYILYQITRSYKVSMRPRKHFWKDIFYKIRNATKITYTVYKKNYTHITFIMRADYCIKNLTTSYQSCITSMYVRKLLSVVDKPENDFTNNDLTKNDLRNNDWTKND